MIGTNMRFRPLMLVASFLMAGSALFTACKDDTPDPVAAPVLAVTGVLPGSGKAGDQVTIVGTGFSTTPTNNSVTFGTATATVVTATPTALLVTVPASLTTTGNVPVSVAITGMTTASATTPFMVNGPVGKPQITITGSITANQNWSAANNYILNNTIYVRSGVTITIEPGTVIKGDKITKGTLIFEQGSKIMAQGTAAAPIIFTSAQPAGLRNLGDWGGLILVGKSAHNLATGVTDANALPLVEGGPTTRVSAIEGQRDNADNSGVLSYVRIEYAGVALSPNNEVNGLSLYAVGSGTKIDHVQVSFANDDSIEWFGGTVNLSNVIAYRGLDDDFDTDNGYSGYVQYGLGVRDLTIADQSGSKGFESDNSATGFMQTPQTSVVFSNMTLLGPTAVTTAGAALSSVVNPSAGAASANYVAAIHIRRNSALSLFNSLVLGWPAGVLIDNSLTAANFAAGRSVFANNIIGGNLFGAITGTTNRNRDILYTAAAGAGSLTPINTLDADSTAFGAGNGPVSYFSKNANRRLLGTDAFLLTGPFLAKPNVLPATGSPALTGAAFTNAKLAPAFFDKTPTFVGAVGTGKDFTAETWVNFDPQNAAY